MKLYLYIRKLSWVVFGVLLNKDIKKAIYYKEYFKSQLPIKRFLYNFCISLNGWRGFCLSAHQYTKSNGELKVKDGIKLEEKAERQRLRMEEKTNKPFSKYVCAFCGKYHVGKK